MYRFIWILFFDIQFLSCVGKFTLYQEQNKGIFVKMKKGPFWISGILIMGFLCGNLTFAQHSLCGPSPVSFSNYCADACLVCDLNGVFAQTTNTIQGQAPPGFCTMVVHSMQWLAFIAGSTNLTLNVSVSSCIQANGVEMGIYASDDCQNFRLVSNCNTNMYANQTWSFTNTEPLKSGCIYYLVFDGNGPNSCMVSFNVVAGSTVAPVPNTTNKITGKKLACVGDILDYSIAPINGACSYEWRVENGTLLSFLDNKATVQWNQAGAGKVCVKGTNACKDGNEVCLDVEIGEPSPIQEFGPYYVCFGESYRFMNLLLTAGTWEFNYKNKYGCDSNTVVYIENLEPIITSLDTTLCYPETLKVGSRKIDSSGHYKVVIPSRVAPYCDSTIFVDVKYARLQAIANKSNDLTCQDTSVLLYADSSIVTDPAHTTYIWTNVKGDTISNNLQVRVQQSGSYVLTIVSNFDSLHACISSQRIDVSGSVNPPKLFLADSLVYCSEEWVRLDALPIDDSNKTQAHYSFHKAFPCDSSNQIADSLVRFQADTILFVLAKNGDCQDALPLFFHIRPKQRLFIMDQELCSGNALDLTMLSYRKEGNFGGGPLFYGCPSKDSSCAILDPLIMPDSTIILYVYPDSASCPDFTSFQLKVKPTPPADAQLSRLDYCPGDSIQLNILNLVANERLFASWDSALLSPLPLQMQHFWMASDTGRHILCLQTELDHCQDSMCFALYVHPPPLVPDIRCEPTDSSILFWWNQRPGERYQMDTLEGGPYIWLSDTSVIFGPLARGKHIRIRVAAKSEYCGERFAELDCQSKTCPTVDLRIIPVDTICLDPGSPRIQLQADSNPLLPGATWIWRGAGIVDSLLGIFDPNTAGAGNHKLTVIADQQGCQYVASYWLVLIPNPFSDFSLDSVLCQDSTMLIRFTGSRADSANFKWTFDGGIIQWNIQNREAEIHWSQAGKKRIHLRLNQYRCASEIFKDVEVFEPLVPPQIQCETTDSFILFRWNIHPRVKKYRLEQWFGNAGQQLNDSTYRIPKRFFKDSAAIRLILEDQGPCSDFQGVVEWCISPDCPKRNMVADTVLRFCSNTPGIIDLNGWVRDTLPDMQWSGEALQQSSVSTSALKPGNYRYILNGSKFGCMYRDTLSIQIHNPPQWGVLDIQEIPCDRLSPFGAVRIFGVESLHRPLGYSLDGLQFQADSIFNQLPEGNYQVFVRDSEGCVSDSQFVLQAPAYPALDLGPDLEILKGERIQLHADISGGYHELVWSSPVLLSCLDCTDPEVAPLESVRLYCLVRNEKGCTTYDSLYIRVVENKVFVPNSFSPNGDQINDFFYLFGNFKILKFLEIFDRWGNRVFYGEALEPNHPEQGWNGRFQGKNCQPGVYVYRARVEFEKGEAKNVQGDLSLIR